MDEKGKNTVYGLHGGTVTDAMLVHDFVLQKGSQCVDER